MNMPEASPVYLIFTFVPPLPLAELALEPPPAVSGRHPNSLARCKYSYVFGVLEG